MKREEVGNLVNYERTKKNIDIRDLSHGLCSEASIQRLERGERTPDFFVLERIIERLGKSMNKVEFLHSEHIYNLCYLRERIEDFIVHEEYDDADGALTYYEGLKEAEEPLHIQYICKMRAVLAEKCGKDSAAFLEKAIKQTMGRFSFKKLNGYVLGEEEIILLLMWLKVKVKEGEAVQKDSEALLHYIEHAFSDEEVFVNLYSKAAWVAIEGLEKENRIREALYLCIKSVELLTGNGLLLHLPQYLERLLKYEKELGAGQEEEYEEWKKQRDALKWVYEEYGHQYETGELALWKNYKLNEAYLISEFISEERKSLNQTQEELAFELGMDQKTISRIETGKYKPKQGTFRKLKEYMGFDRDICNTHIVVDDFALLELEREVSKEAHYRRYEKAKELYEKLKFRLSMKYNENIQYVKYNDCYFRRVLYQDITAEEAIQEFMEAFQVTRRNWRLEDLDKVALTKIEAEIICNIAMTYNKQSRKEEAIQLLEKVKAGYENSRVNTKYHYAGMMVMYHNLCGWYEENNQFQEAIALCIQGIQFELKCMRGLDIGFLVEQKAYTEERMTGNKEASRYYYQRAYYILKLMKKEGTRKSLQRYYKKHYGEEIN